MAAQVELHRELIINDTTGYKVVDGKEKVLGYLVSKEKKNKRSWGFVYISNELESKPNIYRYETKKSALEALLFARFSKTDTSSIKIIK